MNTSPSLDIYNLDFLMRNMFVVPVHYITLQYPGGLIDTGEFRICVRSNNYDESACGTGYNSEPKQPEHVFINSRTRILTVRVNNIRGGGNVTSEGTIL
jgi:hypothetical protein